MADILAEARSRQEAGQVELPREHRKELRATIKSQAGGGRFQIVCGKGVKDVVSTIRAELGEFLDLLYFGVERDGKV